MKRLILVISVLLLPIFSDAEELWLRNVTHVPPGKVLSAITMLTVKGLAYKHPGGRISLK